MNKTTKLFKLQPAFFYNYYVVKQGTQSGLPDYKELIKDDNKLILEFLFYNKVNSNKDTNQFKYNLMKNVFWKLSGFNDMLKSKMDLNKKIEPDNIDDIFS